MNPYSLLISLKKTDTSQSEIQNIQDNLSTKMSHDQENYISSIHIFFQLCSIAHDNRTEMFRSVEMYCILMNTFPPLFIQNNECT